MGYSDSFRHRQLNGADPTSADTVDLADVARTVRRQWRALAYCVIGGGLLAGLVLLFAPRTFRGTATVVVREADPTGSILSRIGGGGGSSSGSSGSSGGSDIGIGSIIAGTMKSPLETELQVLQSRKLLAEVIDTLRLQVRVRAPRGVAPLALVSDVEAPGSFKSRKYTFTRTDAGSYHVSGRGVDTTVTPGATVVLPMGRVVLRESLPASFRLQLYDGEDAINRADKALSVRKAGGEVVRVSFAAADSLTAAAATNELVRRYLILRKAIDRGKTGERVEFLTAQVDTTGAALAAAENALRASQERSGLIDVPAAGELQLEEATTLRKQLGDLQVEEGALTRLVAEVGSGEATPRQLAAYPSFLRSGAINDYLRQLTQLETERTRLLERRLEADPEVQAVDQAIRDIEAQLVPLATAYTASLRQQRLDVTRQLDAMQARLGAFPGDAQSVVRLQRDVLRLGQIYGALQAQLVEARLAAISEGGEVRQLDVATAPKKVSFPQPLLTMGTGLGGGLFIGLIAALLVGTMGRYMEDPRLIERTAGVPALPLHRDAPLLMTGRPLSRTVLLVPLDRDTSTRTAAERLVQTAVARGKTSTVLDLTGDQAMAVVSGAPGVLEAGVNATIEALEREFDTVVVRLPGLSADATAAALNESRPVFLVGSERRVDRERLVGAVATLRRLDVPCAGVVLNGRGDLPESNGRRWG